MSLFWKGILIGLIFGVPVGAMTVQRTWEHGIRAGLFTGMGSSVADCIYAGIGGFGLTMIASGNGWLVVVGVFLGIQAPWKLRQRECQRVPLPMRRKA